MASDLMTSQVIFQEFERARWRSIYTNISSFIQRTSPTLKDMVKTMCGMKRIQQIDRGPQTININRIVGTVGRSNDFDRNFMPRSKHDLHRWMNIDRIYYETGNFPLIEVLKINDEYFVEDGHHRVSVAKFHEQEFIDAHVIEIVTA